MSSKLLGGRNRQKSPRLRSARAFATEVGGDEAIRHNARIGPAALPAGARDLGSRSGIAILPLPWRSGAFAGSSFSPSRS
jgi:hypothetical protein